MTEPQATTGGYASSTRLAQDLNPPPSGTAPGRPDGHVNHGDPILDRHDYRDWVPWDLSHSGTLPDGVRVRHEFSTGEPNAGRFFLHPDDVPTDPDAELVEALTRTVLDYFSDTANGYRLDAKGAALACLHLIRDFDRADR